MQDVNIPAREPQLPGVAKRRGALASPGYAAAFNVYAATRTLAGDARAVLADLPAH